MNRLSPQVLLAILLGVIPLAVLCAGVVSFLLLRSGYGLFVGAALPFLGLLVVVVILGVSLGRAAGGRGGESKGEKPRRRNNV